MCIYFRTVQFHAFPILAVTIASSLVIVLLVMLEFNAYMTLEVNEELFVDTTRNHKLQINLDITMPRISCDYLSLDAMALDGEQHLHIEHNIFKRRLDLEGQVIVDATPEKHDVQLSSTDKKAPGNGTVVEEATTEKPVCGSCYGANKTCCNTCQVRVWEVLWKEIYYVSSGKTLHRTSSMRIGQWAGTWTWTV